MLKAILKAVMIFLVSPSSFGFDGHAELSAAQIWQQAEAISGPQEAMAQRSLMFHKIYLDSGKRLPFALSVSHLTLAIERSLDFGSIDELPWFVPFSGVLKRDMSTWRTSLQSMNKDMFKRTYFAYMFAQQSVLSGKEPYVSESEKEVLKSVRSIIPVMMRVHRSLKNNDILKAYELQSHFETLVSWEHAELFQPQLENIFSGLHWIMKWNLRKIPGPKLEKYLLQPIFDLRSSFNLQCFIDPNKKLQTADFMDPIQRIAQARSFYSELEKINFDPLDFCFNDDYYLSSFPKSFYSNKSEYINEQVELLLHEDKGTIVLPTKINGFKQTLEIKHSTQRFIENLSQSNLCQADQAQFWSHYPSNLIRFPESLLFTQQEGVRRKWSRLEMGVARNALINKAYIDLFLHHARQSESSWARIIPHSWLGSASFGSFSVGKELLYGMYSVFDRMLSDAVLRRFENGDLEKVKSYMSGYTGFIATMPQFLRTLAKANQAVFHDIFWQFLAADICGPEMVVEMLKKSTKVSDQKSISGWEEILAGNYKAGNLKLLRVEQEYVLQPILYDGFLSKYFSWRGIFNRYATPGAPGPNGPLLTFNEYAEKNSLSNNLYNLDSRMAWVNYLIENHAMYFWNLNEKNLLPEAFEDIHRVSDKIIQYYQN